MVNYRPIVRLIIWECQSHGKETIRMKTYGSMMMAHLQCFKTHLIQRVNLAFMVPGTKA